MDSKKQRYTILISVVKVDEDGDDIGEVSGVTLDTATTEEGMLDSIMNELYENAALLFERHIPERSVSERRPESLAEYVV